MNQLSLDHSPPHPSTLPPRVFPPPIPWPEHLPVRHKPWRSQLNHLDQANPQVPRDNWDRDADERGYKRYLHSRVPYVHLASERLQAAVSLKNECEFVLPKVVEGMPPRVNEKGNGRAVSGPGMMPCLRRVLESEVNTGFTSRKRAKTDSPKQPRAMGCQGTSPIDKELLEDGSMRSPELEGFHVDPETGRGLREYMLNMGKKVGMRTVSCESFSFLDFTPGMRDGLPGMRLLKHLVRGEGYTTDAYEIDIPTTFTNDLDGEKHTTNITWLWFLISHDLIDTPRTGIPPPTTYPSSNPSSWIAIALPLAYANKYETVVEYIPTTPSSPHLPVPGHPYHPRPLFPFSRTTLPKRTDYDLSFSGVPIFEFSEKPDTVMAGWSEYLNERNTFRHPSSYELAYDPLEYGREGRFLNLGYVASMGLPGEGGDAWWDAFYRQVYEDIWAWEGVRKAMGRGCLRLVVRWTEFVPALIERGGVGVSPGVGLGINGLEQNEGNGREFEPHPGFGNSLGKRRRTASVPPPLSLDAWAMGFGERLISRGQDSILTPSEIEHNDDLGGTQSEARQETYHMSQEEKEVLEFHYGVGTKDFAIASGNTQIGQHDGAMDFQGGNTQMQRRSIGVGTSDFASGNTQIGQHDGAMDFQGGDTQMQRPSIFDCWPRSLNTNMDTGLHPLHQEGNAAATRSWPDLSSVDQRYSGDLDQNNSSGFQNSEGQNQENDDTFLVYPYQPSQELSPGLANFLEENSIRVPYNVEEGDKNKENQKSFPGYPPQHAHEVPQGFGRPLTEDEAGGFLGSRQQEMNSQNQNTFSNYPHHHAHEVPQGFTGPLTEDEAGGFLGSRQQEMNSQNQNTFPNHPHHQVPQGLTRPLTEDEAGGFLGSREDYMNSENQNPHFVGQFHNSNPQPQMSPVFVTDPYGNQIMVPTPPLPPTMQNGWRQYCGLQVDEQALSENTRNQTQPSQSFTSPALARFFNAVNQSGSMSAHPSMSTNQPHPIHDLMFNSPAPGHQNIYPYKASSLYAGPSTPRPDPKYLYFAHKMEMGNGPVGWVGSPWLGGDPAVAEKVEDVVVFSRADQMALQGNLQCTYDGHGQAQQYVKPVQLDGPSDQTTIQYGQTAHAQNSTRYKPNSTPFRLALSHHNPDCSPRFTNCQLQDLKTQDFKYQIFKGSPSIETPPFVEDSDQEEEEDSEEEMGGGVGCGVDGAGGVESGNGGYGDGGISTAATRGSEAPKCETGCTILMDGHGGENAGEYDEGEYQQDYEGDYDEDAYAAENESLSPASTLSPPTPSTLSPSSTEADTEAETEVAETEAETDNTLLDPRLWHAGSEVQLEMEGRNDIGGMCAIEESTHIAAVTDTEAETEVEGENAMIDPRLLYAGSEFVEGSMSENEENEAPAFL